MSDAAAFTLVCDHLERSTGLDRPAARGTVRLALKEAGFDSESVSPRQMRGVVKGILPTELHALRIEDVPGHTQSLLGRLKRLEARAQIAPAV